MFARRSSRCRCIAGTSSDGLFDDGVGELGLDGLGVLEAGHEGVAEGHEFTDFCDDAVLFGERWNWNGDFS